MKITKRQLRSIINEEIALIREDKDTRINDNVVKAIAASAFPIAIASYILIPSVREQVNKAYEGGVDVMEKWLENSQDEWRR